MRIGILAVLVLLSGCATVGAPAVSAEAELRRLVASAAREVRALTETTEAGATDAGAAQVSATLPAVISITEALPDARFPNFKGIMAAKKKPFETVSLADLGVDIDPASAPQSILTQVSEKPPRGAGVKITDEGDAGEKLAAYLIENRLA